MNDIPPASAFRKRFGFLADDEIFFRAIADEFRNNDHPTFPMDFRIYTPKLVDARTLKHVQEQMELKGYLFKITGPVGMQRKRYQITIDLSP